MKKCINHPERKYYAKGLCVACYSQIVRERNRNNPQYQERERKRGRDNWAVMTPEKKLEKSYKRNYGLTYAEVRGIYDSQDGQCASCNDPVELGFENGVVDHCHMSGKVRGILCSPCNKALGHVYDNVTRLKNLIVYLEKVQND